MKRFLGVLGSALLALGLAQTLRPQGIVVNPTPPPDLQVRVWVDKDPSKSSNPVYQFGEPIQISVQVTQPAYVYLFSVRATGEIVGILPNAFEQQNFLQAGEVRTFPGPGARYTFTVEGPAGQDRVLAVASRRPLDVSEIVDIQTGQARIRGVNNLARSLSIVVSPLPSTDWVTDEAYFIAGQLPPPPTTGTLVLNSSPSEAQALIDGRVVGTTPLVSSKARLRGSTGSGCAAAVTTPCGSPSPSGPARPPLLQSGLPYPPPPPPTGLLAVDSNPAVLRCAVGDRASGPHPPNLTLAPRHLQRGACAAAVLAPSAPPSPSSLAAPPA